MTNPKKNEVDMQNLKELKERADKVIDLWKLMNEIFPDTKTEDHLRIAIMAAIQDATYQGFHKAETTREQP